MILLSGISRRRFRSLLLIIGSVNSRLCCLLQKIQVAEGKLMDLNSGSDSYFFEAISSHVHTHHLILMLL